MANKFDLDVYRGDTVKFDVTWKQEDGTPIDVSVGYTAKMQARKTARAPDPPIFEVDQNTGIDLSQGEGLIAVTVPASATAELRGFSSATYDLELTHVSTATVNTLVYGNLKMKGDVTK